MSAEDRRGRAGTLRAADLEAAGARPSLDAGPTVATAASVNGDAAPPAEAPPTPPRGATHAVFNQPPPLEDVNLAALLAEIELARGADRRLDAWMERLRDEAAPLGCTPAEDAMGRAEPLARRLVEGLATALQASLLVRHSPAAVADAFCAGRLEERGLAFGTLPAGLGPAAIAAIQERHAPHADGEDARAHAG